MKMKTILFFFSSVWIFSSAWGVNLSGTIFEQVGNEKDIDPILLYAVALAESAYSPNEKISGASPYPWTVRGRGQAFYASSKKEAERELFSLLLYTQNVDIGLMQVNYRWHKHRVNRAEDLLDPITSLRVGADILREQFVNFPDDLISALGSYHSNDPKRKLLYGMTVFNIYNSIRSNGLQHHF